MVSRDVYFGSILGGYDHQNWYLVVFESAWLALFSPCGPLGPMLG